MNVVGYGAGILFMYPCRVFIDMSLTLLQLRLSGVPAVERFVENPVESSSLAEFGVSSHLLGWQSMDTTR